MAELSTKVNPLWRALRERDEDTLTCAMCEEQLPAYLEAQQQGSNNDVWRAVARHLQSCPHCATLYTELHQLVQQATVASSLTDLSAAPAPDLTFLTTAPSHVATDPAETARLVSSSWWWIDEAGQLLITFSTELLATFTPPPLVGIKGSAERLLYHLTLADIATDLEVTISVQSTDAAAQCALWVDVNRPNTGGWPHLAGTVVTLWRNTEWLAQQVTDAYGKVVFPEVARDDLASLRLSIAPILR